MNGEQAIRRVIDDLYDRTDWMPGAEGVLAYDDLKPLPIPEGAETMARPDLGAIMAGAERDPAARPFDRGANLRFLREHRPDTMIRLKSGKRLRLGDGAVFDRNGYPDEDWVYGTYDDPEVAEVMALLDGGGEALPGGDAS